MGEDQQPVWEDWGDGLISTIVTGPQVLPTYARCKEELRALHIRRGFRQCEYVNFAAAHVETGRDRAAQHMLNCDYNWMVQLDADAVFDADAVLRLLHTLFEKVPQSDMAGAYCQLKNSPHLPTLDTGTGTWEEHYPNSGIMPVIRTGTHAFAVKRRAFEKMGPPPWFRSRRTLRTVDAMAHLDNVARMNYDGDNPLADETWEEMLSEAKESADDDRSYVGEDSGFCDRLRANGGQIVVNTDIVVGHQKTKTVEPEDLADEMNRRRRTPRLACGILEETRR